MTLTEGALRFSFGASCTARTAVNCHRWQVVLHLEQRPTRKRLRPTALSSANVLQKLQRILKAIDALPKVVDRNNPHPAGCWDGRQRTGEEATVNRKQIQDAFFIVLLVGLTVAFIRLLAPYLVAVAVAVILALLLRHPLNWLLRRGVARGLATALVVVALIVLGSVFLVLFGILVTSELEEGVRTVRSEWPKLLAWAQERLPWVQALVQQFELEQRISDLLGNAASQILSLSQTALSSLAGGVVRAVVVAFLVIYLLLEGEKLVERLYRLLPLDRAHTDELMQHAARTLDATVLGTLFIGVLEGTFGGLLFALFGLPSATLWGLIMVLVSVLPLLGINAVVVPAGVVLIIMGDVGRGVGLIVVGVAGAMVSQNLLRPKLVGDRSGLHPALVLLATLGGLAWLGLVGFVIGPMLATLATIAWEQFASRHGEDTAS